MLKLKLQYFGHLMQRADSLEKTLMLGKIEGRSRREGQRIRRLDGIIDPMDMNLSKLQEIVKDREAWCAVSTGLKWVKHDCGTEQQLLLDQDFFIMNCILALATSVFLPEFLNYNHNKE